MSRSRMPFWLVKASWRFQDWTLEHAEWIVALTLGMIVGWLMA